MAKHSSILARIILCGERSLAGYIPQGPKESKTQLKQLSMHSRSMYRIYVCPTTFLFLKEMCLETCFFTKEFSHMALKNNNNNRSP